LFLWSIHGFHSLMLFTHFLEGSNWPLDFIIELFEGIGLSLRAIIVDEIWLFVSFLWITSWLLWKFLPGLTMTNSMNFEIKIWRATFPWNVIYRVLIRRLGPPMTWCCSFVFLISQFASILDSLLWAYRALTMTSPGHITLASLALPGQVLAWCRLQNAWIGFLLTITLVLASTSIVLIECLIIGGCCCFVYNT